MPWASFWLSAATCTIEVNSKTEGEKEGGGEGRSGGLDGVRKGGKSGREERG